MTEYYLVAGDRCPECGTTLRSVSCGRCKGTGSFWLFFGCRNCDGAGEVIQCPNHFCRGERDSGRAFEAASVEFIDENGGGPGVRLRHRQQRKR